MKDLNSGLSPSLNLIKYLMDNLGWKQEQLLDAVNIQIRKDMQKELTPRILNNIISGYKTPSY